MACPAGRVSAEGEGIYNERARDAGQTLGDWWDAHRAEGDVFHRTLVHPDLPAQLALQPRDRVLDLACGNGALARTIARHGRHVTGVDSSHTLLRHAHCRTAAEYIIRPFLIITFPGSQIRDINQPGCGTSGSTCPPVSSAFRARLLL